MNNINELTPDNCAFALIDHQPWVAFPVRSITPEELLNNVTALAKVASALGIPTVLSTVFAEGGRLADPLFEQLRRVFPEVRPIDRRNTNAWSDPAFVAAVRKTGRRKLVMAGLWTEVCLAQTVLAAVRDGYEVFFVSDASGGVSAEAHLDAKARMVQAGAHPMTWQAVMSELCPDLTAPEYVKLVPVAVEHGGGTAYGVQYILAQGDQAA
jgi:nicotinamidase-related amidase